MRFFTSSPAATTHSLAHRCAYWGFAPGHVLINEARSQYQRPCLQRCLAMDNLASNMAKGLVENDDKKSLPVWTRQDLQATLRRPLVAQFVCRGNTTPKILRFLMRKGSETGQAILSLQYNEFGFATAPCANGELILVLLLRS